MKQTKPITTLESAIQFLAAFGLYSMIQAMSAVIR